MNLGKLLSFYFTTLLDEAVNPIIKCDFLRPLRWHFLIDPHWRFAWFIALRQEVFQS